MLADLLRHLQQNAVNLSLFFIHQAHEFVVLLDCLQWFKKHSLPAGTCAMHDPLHPPLLLDFNRYDETLAANCDHLILHRTTFG